MRNRRAEVTPASHPASLHGPLTAPHPSSLPCHLGVCPDLCQTAEHPHGMPLAAEGRALARSPAHVRILGTGHKAWPRVGPGFAGLSLMCLCIPLTLWTVARQAPLSMGILQARILEWVAIPFSRGSSRYRDQTRVSCVSCTAMPSAGPAGPRPIGLAREVREETQGHLQSEPDPCEDGKAAGPQIQGVSPSLSTQESFRCEGVSGVDTEEVSKNQRWTCAVCLPTTQSLGPDH